MSSHLPPPIAPPSVGTHPIQPEHVGQGYAHSQQTYQQQVPQTFAQAPLNGYPQMQNGCPVQQQPLQNQYMEKTPTLQKSSAPTQAPVVIGHISNYHSKDSQRQDNTYHPSLSPKQTTEALVESAVARHHTRVDVLFLKAVWGGILLS